MRLLTRIVSGAALGAALLAPSLAAAQADRSYSYKDFAVTYAVQPDASVNVTEVLTYGFQGSYHQGFRSLPHAGSDRITDIRLVDESTGKPLARSLRSLDKLDPSSWGKYTTYVRDGSTYVEWYYDLSDTTHAWKLSYTLHGAVTFYDSHDELYWNLFSGLDAPVEQAQATVLLPQATSIAPSQWYVNGDHEAAIGQPDDRTIVFTAQRFSAGEAATIAAGWQKGIVSRNLYWLDAARTYWLYAASALVLLGTALFLFFNWFFKLRARKPVIVAEYEPPEGIPPAEAGVLAYGSYKSRLLSATVVDFAVRGYLTIAEDEKKPSSARTGLLLAVIPAAAVLVAVLFLNGNGSILLWVGIAAVAAVAAQGLIYLGSKYASKTPDYTVTEVPDADLAKLKTYELKVLDALFASKDSPGVFSTRVLRKAQKSRAAEFMLARTALRDGMDDDTHAYVPGHSPKRGSNGFQLVILALLLPAAPAAIAAAVFPAAFTAALKFGFGLAVLLFSYALIRYQLKFATRLNAHGLKLRNALLGFREYLYTAERYRLQDLTPDRFEKYLPYAIAFGVEKEWAKAFESLNLPAPQWYSGAYAASSGSYPGGFSAPDFASSLSASFASSFSSASGGGFSGGGGGAGGGGGGGGGGAS
jgi:uncharacterized membrane protein YgcG